jgi:hypothetical protein
MNYKYTALIQTYVSAKNVQTHHTILVRHSDGAKVDSTLSQITPREACYLTAKQEFSDFDISLCLVFKIPVRAKSDLCFRP